MFLIKDYKGKRRLEADNIRSFTEINENAVVELKATTSNEQQKNVFIQRIFVDIESEAHSLRLTLT